MSTCTVAALSTRALGTSESSRKMNSQSSRFTAHTPGWARRMENQGACLAGGWLSTLRITAVIRSQSGQGKADQAVQVGDKGVKTLRITRAGIREGWGVSPQTKTYTPPRQAVC
jgi:predicted metalloprotease